MSRETFIDYLQEIQGREGKDMLLACLSLTG